MSLDVILAWVGDDRDRLFDLFDVETHRPSNQRNDALIGELRNRIAATVGAWPYPDDTDEAILAGAGTPGQPAGLVLRRLESWPPPYRRDALIDQLRARVGNDLNHFALHPVAPGTEP